MNRTTDPHRQSLNGPQHIVISGASGRLARVLIPRLLSGFDNALITGFDLQPSLINHPRYQHYQIDVRSTSASSLIEKADIFVHMAFVLMGGHLGRHRHNPEIIKAINLQATTQLLDTALQGRCQHLIFLSSAAVYGAWADNPPRLREDHPLRPIPGFLYSEHKVAVEKMLNKISQDRLLVTCFRPHAIVGPNAHPLLNRLLSGRVHPTPSGLTQCVWEDDVVEAMYLSMRDRRAGTFNLAADPPMTLSTISTFNRRWHIPVPIALAEPLHRILWAMTPSVGEPGWVAAVRHSLVLDTSKAKTLLGWQPQRSVPDAINAMRQANKL